MTCTWLSVSTAIVHRDAGWDHSEDSSRGYDHGVFVPLHFIFPQADVPVVQLSLMSNMDAEVIAGKHCL